MLPDPNWQPVGAQAATMHIHKDNGRLFWNARTQQYLGNPQAVKIEFDADLQWISILKDSDYTVVEDEDGNYYIDAKDALEECGFSFPLSEHVYALPDEPESNINRVIFKLEEG